MNRSVNRDLLRTHAYVMEAVTTSLEDSDYILAQAAAR
jgi:hypothetical protein